MYCKECGKEIPNDSKYCNHCGIKQTDSKKVVIQVPEIEVKANLSRTSKILLVSYTLWSIVWLIAILNTRGMDSIVFTVFWLFPLVIYIIPKIWKWMIKQK